MPVLNLDEFCAAARRALPRIVFDFVEGGCDGESGLARNREAFDHFALMPRYLVGVSSRNQSVTVLGRRYDAPFGVCPMGHCGMARPGVDLMLARAAAKANIPYLMSSASNGTMEAAAGVAAQNMWYQIYNCADQNIDFDMLRRAETLSINVLVVTADVPVSSNRERNRRNGFGRPPKLSAAAALEALLHPTWIARFYASGGIPPLANWLPYAPAGTVPIEGAADLFGKLTPDPSMGWERLKKIRERWSGKLLVKGILSPADALAAVNLGADGLIVSNHGGRQLDSAPATIDMLPFIKAAVGDRAELLLDSGVRRGSDIVKALSLGARTTLFGRPWLYAAAAAGEEGVEQVIAIMRREVDLMMGQLGLRTLDEACTDTVWAPDSAGLATLARATAAVSTLEQTMHVRSQNRAS